MQCYKSNYGQNILSKMLEQNLNFLKGYIAQPAENKMPWVPRSLIISGALVRYFDLTTLDKSIRDAAICGQEHLFSIGMSHFVNHTQEIIRRSAIYALGAVCIRDPKKLFQTPCSKWHMTLHDVPYIYALK